MCPLAPPAHIHRGDHVFLALLTVHLVMGLGVKRVPRATSSLAKEPVWPPALQDPMGLLVCVSPVPPDVRPVTEAVARLAPLDTTSTVISVSPSVPQGRLLKQENVSDVGQTVSLVMDLACVQSVHQATFYILDLVCQSVLRAPLDRMASV